MNDKTEPPTPKKLRDARKKGQVAKSKEIASAALLTVVFVMLYTLMPSFVSQIRDMILAPVQFYEGEFFTSADALLDTIINASVAIFGPVVIVVAAVGVVANLAQVGLLFSAESLKPKLSNLSPMSGFKKIFAMKNLFEFLKSVFKIGFLSLLMWLVISGALPELVKIPACGIGCIPPVLAKVFLDVMVYTIAAFCIVAAADYVFEKWKFMKDQKMSKEEIKKEFKESEGDPHIKGKRKQFAQELIQSNEDAGVRKSKVVVTNPIHLAIAIDYRQGETPLPIIRAMGQNIRAKRIVQIAEEEGIPIMQNVPLAHGLFEAGKVNTYIPVDLMEEVAEVLKAVIELENEQNPENET
ncbi:MAG: type III secretion system export apparatus subunit SctU [Pseudomonadota bacterium]